MLDVKSVTKGVLFPRMTETERDAIENPADGLLIFNTTTMCLDYYFANSWKSVCGASEPAFECGMIMTDARDGNTYATIKIGTQCWMAENLNVGTMINSTTGGTGGDGNQTDNSVLEKYCYENNEANCNTYGALYQWDEMMQYVTTQGAQGICPDGWHVPTDAEWTALTTYVSSQPGYVCENDPTFIAKVLAATTKWDASTDLCAVGNDLSANNAIGFTALPVGFRSVDGSFGRLSSRGYLWSSSLQDASYAWCRYLKNDGTSVYRFSYLKANGFSVRCLKD
jgi:uncharacterized protein (TIGR02145 family)